MMNLLKFSTIILLTPLNSTPVQNFNSVGRSRRLNEMKMWQNRDLGLDPGLNSPEDIILKLIINQMGVDTFKSYLAKIFTNKP